ncbi:electron transfer flavoprotein subunit alpha/FixB family protein [Cellulomonas sp. NTE-D12]|uniref:electron transfer flavoprotein subunit alpha/FixB family protein n=1 Tax=Cellulomonas sp. NTE-D12 TaxID=2962632 RepID=UPI0030812245|nr:electron transfer flavoprotein subunit alpha [Cellulomonas sp. NTE-D12]
MTSPVLVLLDHAADGALRPSAAELVTLARPLAGDGGVLGAWVGDGPGPDALAVLAAHGVAAVHAVRPDADPALSAVTAEAVTAVLGATGAGLVLIPSTFEGKEVAAHLAASTGAGVVTDADGVQLQDGVPVASKTVLAGTWTTRCSVVGAPAVVTVKANAVPAEPVAAPREPVVVEHELTVSPAARRVELVERTERAASDRPDLSGAQVVVVGGRGTEGDFGPIEELADLLGAAVGATRVATDEGWIAKEAQIGQTGVTVTPRLYIGAGVSGAVHHRGGMQAAGTIVAVNSDPDAPIFEIADFGVVGDLFTVLPQATAELRRLLG